MFFPSKKDVVPTWFQHILFSTWSGCPNVFSPPVRWGLSDFMWVVFSSFCFSFSSFSSSSSSNFRLWRTRSRTRACWPWLLCKAFSNSSEWPCFPWAMDLWSDLHIGIKMAGICFQRNCPQQRILHDQKLQLSVIFHKVAKANDMTLPASLDVFAIILQYLKLHGPKCCTRCHHDDPIT